MFFFAIWILFKNGKDLLAPDLPLACHGSQDALLGECGRRLKLAKGLFGSKNYQHLRSAQKEIVYHGKS